MLKTRLPNEFTVFRAIVRGVIVASLFTGGVLIIAFVFNAPTAQQKSEKETRSNVASNKTETVQSNKNTDNSPFDNISIKARAAMVWDVNQSKVLFSRNENEVLPLASLSKIMNVIVASDTLKPDEVVTIDDKALAMSGDNGLLKDERWELRDLLSFLLITSSNDAAHATAATAAKTFGPDYTDNSTSDGTQLETKIYSNDVDYFVERMNRKAKAIGLSNTHFLNESGLDENATTTGAYGSTKDMVKLMEYAISHYPQLFKATKNDVDVFISLNNISHTAHNTNTLINEIPGLIASKTGYTDLAGGNLIIAFNPGLNRPLIISVLGSDFNGRFEDVSKLKDAALKYLSSDSSDTPSFIKSQNE